MDRIFLVLLGLLIQVQTGELHWKSTPSQRKIETF
jgi:hypothetical protein